MNNHLQNNFMHVVQIEKVFLSDFVAMKDVDHSTAGVAGLSN